MQRFVLHSEKEELTEYFELSTEGPDIMYGRHYNIQPGIRSPFIINRNGKPVLEMGIWGISSSSNEQVLSSIHQKEAVNDSFIVEQIQTKPCIIPANGFYKWKKNVEDPLPFYIRVLTMDVLAIPGIYQNITDEDGNEFLSFAIFTMDANALVEPLDETMPCILETAQIEEWLNGNALKMIHKGFTAQKLLPQMAVYRVADLVNDPENNSPDLIQPIPKLRDDDDD